MKNIIYSALATTLSLSAAGPALAQAASPADAEQITRALEKYLGPVSKGDKPLLTVTPSGENFSVTFAFERLMSLLQGSGVKVSISPDPMNITLSKLPDGKWRTIQKDNFAVTFDGAGNKATINAEGLTADSIYDPVSASVISGVSDVKVISSDSSNDSPRGMAMKVARISHDVHTEMKGVGIAPGVSTTSFTQTIHDTTQHISVTTPGGEGTKAPVDIDIVVGPVNVDGKIEGMRNRAALDLWAWLVAHPTREAIAAQQAEFKGLLRAALPVFDRMDMNGNVNAIAVTSPLGKFGATRAEVGFGANGVRESGAVREMLALKGMEIPSTLLPAWSQAITPRDAIIDVNVAGYDLAHVAEAAIAAFDLEKSPVMKPADQAGLIGKLLPSGAVDMTITKIGLAGAGYDLSIVGHIKAGPGEKPVGAATIRLAGLDVLQKALTEGAKTDKNAQQAIAGLGIARMLAKQDADGASIWEIAMGEDGKLMVNGSPMGGGAGK